MRVRFILAGLAVACACATVQAGGEHERRLAAKLAIIAGDVRRLTTDRDAGPLEREGLVQRLRGALSSLPLLLRRANGDPKRVVDLRAALARNDLRAFSGALASLQRRYPFDARPLLAAVATPEMRTLGATIHRTTCFACHDNPTGDSLFPLKNLAVQIKTMPRDEFAARLLLGIRGDRTTRWRNPFSDLELRALVAHYDSGQGALASSPQKWNSRIQ